MQRPAYVEIIHESVARFSKGEVVASEKLGSDEEFQRLLNLGAIAVTDATHEVGLPADPKPTPHPDVHSVQPEPPAPTIPHENLRDIATEIGHEIPPAGFHKDH